VAAAAFYQMAGLLLYEDTGESMLRHKKCGSKAPHVVINTAAGSDPLTPGFPAVGLLRIIYLECLDIFHAVCSFVTAAQM
jgi:hypothetical protein